MIVWDYDLNKNWKPKTSKEWEWFLVRKINYGDFQGLKRKIIKKYFHKVEKQLDPGKQVMLKHFLYK